MSDIPLIDLSGARLGSEGEREVARQIDAACRDAGVFVAHGHGIDRRLFADVYQALGAFFDLPIGDKVACKAKHGVLMPGDEYTPYGYTGLMEENAYAYMGIQGKANDCVEKFSTGRLVIDGGAGLYFPDGEIGNALRSSLRAYYLACQRFTSWIAELFTLPLGVPRDYFTSRMNQSNDSLRGHRYPAVGKHPEGAHGMGEHTDSTLLTLLTHTAPGIDVRMRDGRWVTPPPYDIDHFIVNIGDLMAHWTNKVYVSTPHRVTLADRDRFSLVFFKLTNEDDVVMKGNKQMEALFGLASLPGPVT